MAKKRNIAIKFVKMIWNDGMVRKILWAIGWPKTLGIRFQTYLVGHSWPNLSQIIRRRSTSLGQLVIWGVAKEERHESECMSLRQQQLRLGSYLSPHL